MKKLKRNRAIVRLGCNNPEMRKEDEPNFQP